MIPISSEIKEKEILYDMNKGKINMSDEIFKIMLEIILEKALRERICAICKEKEVHYLEDKFAL